MFRTTDRQTSLESPGLWLPEGAAQRLKASWAEPFQHKILPLLLQSEDEFRELYSDVGRPNWSIARLLGICLLQEWFALDDQRALDAMAFDVRWQHALGMTAEEAYLSRRSLVEFRSRMVQADPSMEKLRGLFDRITDAAVADLGRSLSKQRLDSTLFCSNITTRGRVDLFRKTLKHFLRGLSAQWPEKLVLLRQDIQALIDPEEEKGWFSPPTGKQQRILLATLARWLWEVRETFASDKEVSVDERYQLVCRVLDEQCRVVEPQQDPPDDGDDGGDSGGDGHRGGSDASADGGAHASGDGSTDEPSSSSSATAVTLRRKPHPKGTSLQSPYDPDATYGHKGQGYHLHVTETCGNEGHEIITDFEVTGAHEHDCTRTAGILERLAGAERSPDELYADGGYASGNNILSARSLGIDLLSPVTRCRLPEDMVGRDQFTFDTQTGEVISCPAGHSPTRHCRRIPVQGGPPTRHAAFDRRTCLACPLEGRCVARSGSRTRPASYFVNIEPNLRARDEALARQAELSWWLDYRIRSGIEGVPSELKRTHGLRRLRVRRGSPVLLAVSMKVTACNVKRWLRAVLRRNGLDLAFRIVHMAALGALWLLSGLFAGSGKHLTGLPGFGDHRGWGAA
jgi:Transposase DDE domain/Transposase domain (DUF772)